MIVGLGTDAIEIYRFEHWASYSDARLRRIFTQPEIDYCRSVPTKTAERFAARFAAKEAFFKAAYTFFDLNKFVTVARFIEVARHSTGTPSLKIAWEKLNVSVYENVRAHLSFTHSKKTTIAVVILELA